MSKIRKSLEENLDFIRSQLPDELKDHAESCLDAADELIDQMPTHDIKKTILDSLPTELQEELQNNIEIPQPVAKPSFEQQKQAVLDALAPEHHASLEQNIRNELIS